jgi:hypothetical protein
MNEKEEQAFEMGCKAFARRILGECVREIGQTDVTAEAWRLERADAVAALRSLCEDFGDNEWPDDLHLADVINKHLLPYLDEYDDPNESR